MSKIKKTEFITSKSTSVGTFRIVKLSIKKLFAIFDYDLDLSRSIDNVLILYGVNGTGKTTILNMIYYFLKLRFEEFLEIKFDSIEFTMQNIAKKDDLCIIKIWKDLNEDIQDFQFLLSYNSKEFKKSYKNDLINTDHLFDFISSAFFASSSIRFNFPVAPDRIFSIARAKEEEKLGLMIQLSPNKKDKELPMNYTIILPKEYPVVDEEFLLVLGKIFNNSSCLFITSQRLNVSTSDLRKFLEMAEKKVRKLNDIKVIDDKETSPSKIKDADLNNQFSRLNLEELKRGILNNGLKQRIVQIEEYLHIEKSKVDILLSIINKFFERKSIQIEKSKLVIKDELRSLIPIEKLSSGEKNLFIILVDIVFLKSRSVILIDEPEISLHVSWQASFVNTLLELSKQFAFSFIIATHSPIIGNIEEISIGLDKED